MAIKLQNSINILEDEDGPLILLFQHFFSQFLKKFFKIFLVCDSLCMNIFK